MPTYTVRELWELACQWDKIPPDSKFVVFSPDNPWAKKYNFAMCCIAHQKRGQ